MPHLTINGARLAYERQGGGPETILFAHSLLWSRRMFAPQIAALAPRYRCVTFDFRGQGQSEVTAGGYDVDSLTADAAAAHAPDHYRGYPRRSPREDARRRCRCPHKPGKAGRASLPSVRLPGGPAQARRQSLPIVVQQERKP